MAGIEIIAAEGRSELKDFRIENLKAPVALSKAANARSFITALCSKPQNDSLLVMGFVFVARSGFASMCLL